MRIRTLNGPHAALLVLLGSCRSGGAPLARVSSLEVVSGWALPSIEDVTTAFVRLRSTGPFPDTLLEVRTPPGGHGMIMGMNGGRMFDLPALVLPAGGEIAMREGGTHLMFDGLTRGYARGDSMPLVLRFARAGEVAVRVPVVRSGESP
jgi:copper(I)-binding protein